MGLIGSLAIALLVIAGCTEGGKNKCLADSTAPPSSCAPTSEAPPRPTYQTIEKSLDANGYSRTTKVGAYPATWTKEDTTVVVGKDLSGSVEVAFPQGKVRCTHLGSAPSGPNPLELANDLKAKGFGLARTTFGCAGL